MKLLFQSMGILSVLIICTTGCSPTKSKQWAHLRQDTLYIKASQFRAGENTIALGDSANLIHFVIAEKDRVPFNQSVVKQTNEQAAYGPDAKLPYFTVRFAVPIPPAYTPFEVGTLAGLEHGVYHHNHSPGFEIMPNGDALAVYFSSPAGKSESDTAATFVQARLRHGSEDWDMPEVFFDTQFGNDQSGLLWNDKGKIWFFGGGRYISDYVPFRIAVSTDNGASWTFSVPQLDTAATDYTAQPVVNAFRDPQGGIYMVCDGDGSESFLWYSADEGKNWKDKGGRTGSRHSTILPLDDKGTLLAQGGKNADIEGWNVRNISHDWGVSWEEGTSSPFPPLGTAQRPSMIRLASGCLFYVTDSYMHKKNIAPPAGWEFGNNAVVAISKDNGETWHIKPLPVQLPQRHRPPHGSLGYSTARQAPNGVIHILTTANFPPIHYELNEAWIWSDLADITPESDGGEVKSFTETYKDGRLKSAWSARICPNGRYLLHGETTDYYENGAIQHVAVYENGRKSGEELYYDKEGKLEWKWQRDLLTNTGVWTQYWPNGNKKVESTWNIRPQARDLNRAFFGYVAEGPSTHWDSDGNLIKVYQFSKGLLQE
ncbi:MAG: hypothetical protein ACOX59_03975 [Bacteroidales bacterium]|jgi:antitoxin component YwqK of YwqJK toxin-antitoxin module|nr:exo-alpha-sialidase [Bacteroidota bacterium]